MYAYLHMSDCVKNLSHYLRKASYEIGKSESIQYGCQIPIRLNGSSVYLRIYTKAKNPGCSKIDVSLLQLKGRDPVFHSHINQLIKTIEQWNAIKPMQAQVSPRPILKNSKQNSTQNYFQHNTNRFIPHIGTDESGKGDYFGPLVVAAFLIKSETQQKKLQSLQIQDSKLLSDKLISTLAPSLLLYPHAVQIQFPKRYNALYKTHANLNILLAQQHAIVINALSQRTGYLNVISDQFGKKHRIQDALVKMKRTDIQLQQYFHAENDVAVACASVLARFYFLKYLNRIKHMCHIDLPKGASQKRIVEVGQSLVNDYGSAILNRVAKTHFKTTQQILQ